MKKKNNNIIIEAKMNMDSIASNERIRSIFQEALIRWGGRKKFGNYAVDDNTYSKIIESLKNQVEARFVYDYKAYLDYNTGVIKFVVKMDYHNSKNNSSDTNDELIKGYVDESFYRNNNKWVLRRKKNGIKGLAVDENGKPMSEIIKECEKACEEYIYVALSYSAASLVDSLKE